MSTNLKLYFSLISGELYYIEEDEIKNLDNTQIPLIKKPDPKCKKCYGRFYIGKEIIKNYYMPCPKCSRKCIDWNKVKDEITVATPKQTNVIDDDFSKAVNSLPDIK